MPCHFILSHYLSVHVKSFRLILLNWILLLRHAMSCHVMSCHVMLYHINKLKKHILVCSYDYLRISNENNQTVGTYCGQRSGLNVRITGRYAVMYFHSDGSVTRRGYKLFFSPVNLGKYSELDKILFK